MQDMRLHFIGNAHKQRVGDVILWESRCLSQVGGHS
jgi:hypothetical protein